MFLYSDYHTLSGTEVQIQEPNAYRRQKISNLEESKSNPKPKINGTLSPHLDVSNAPEDSPIHTVPVSKHAVPQIS